MPIEGGRRNINLPHLKKNEEKSQKIYEKSEKIREKNRNTSTCLPVIGAAIIEFETCVIAVAGLILEILDDGICIGLLDNARRIPAIAAEGGLFATAIRSVAVN